MRFEVPQFIEIEDKIFGPFTWRQFVYLAGGVGLAAVIFLITPLFVFIIIGIPIGGLGLALAFYPVNNQPFSVFLESIFRFYRSGQTYHWRSKRDTVYRDKAPALASKAIYTTPDPDNNLHSISKKLELEALQKDI